MERKNKYSISECMSDYWKLLGSQRFKYSWFAFLRLFSDVTFFINAFILGLLVNFLTDYSKGESLNIFYIYLGLILFTSTIQVWIRFVSKINLQTIGANLRKNIRIDAMSFLMDQSLLWHQKEDSGAKIQKINSGSEQVFEISNMVSNTIMYIFTGLLFNILIFSFIDYRYILFVLVYVGFYLTGEIYFNKKLSVWQDKLNKINEKVSGKFQESASNLLTVKSMGLKDSFKKSTKDFEDEYYQVWVKMRELRLLKSKVVKMFAAFGYALFICLLGFDVISSTIKVGMLLTFSTYFGALRRSLEDITNFSTKFIKMKSGFGRLMLMFKENNYDVDDSKLLDVKKDWENITFENVYFRFKKKYVLKNFSLTITKGDKIGIVGRSGNGKSTIIKLLLGLYKPEKGQIKIDGVDIRKFKHKSLSKVFGVVLQDSEMFNMSLKNNISISSEKIDVKKLKRSIDLSGIKPIVDDLPEGLDTLIGEKGYKLSGGERQRVGIARVLYKDTPVLIFDEATSALDSKTEKNIQDSIDNKLDDKTLILIAHRLSTLKNTSRIIVLEDGLIKEDGSFNDLIKQKGIFSELYKLQKSGDVI